ncbi:trichohyalin-like [Gigantopelta aegis]|uniref:trichohyalin-like n=1 Tax=Gigantopelta aegis TaxID=1735272 RepID=UPI001B88A5DB|nr:trichohyalin-like [Gigantopelta aegis]
MGELGTEKHQVLSHVFHQYDRKGIGELSPIQVQILHADIRMGGISLPQVFASINYTCNSGSSCVESELCDLLQEMDRRYFLLQNLCWEFSMLDREQKDTITEEQARWLAQAVHGKYFSKRKWEEFLRSRPVPGGRVSFQEIEVMLCNIPDRMTIQQERQDEEREKDERLRRQRELEEAAEKERERLKREREEDKMRREQEKKKSDDDRKRKELEEEERKRREEEERRRREEEEEKERLRKLQEEEERKRKEDEEKYKDVENIKEEAERKEKEARDHLDRLKKSKEVEKDRYRKQEIEMEESKVKKILTEYRNQRIRYQLKVAIKSRDRYQLEYSITEFKKADIRDEDMDLEKAERLLKEFSARDDLHKAMTKREIQDLEKALSFVKKHGFEAQLASEVMEANQMLVRLKRLERIRHEILELKQSTVAEIRSYQNPPVIVHTVMTVTFLLLGHKEKETKDWKAVQALVGKTGKESLKRCCIQCEADKIPLAAAKRAKTLLAKYDLDEVRDVSAGAATFYVWATTMIEEAIDLQTK